MINARIATSKWFYKNDGEAGDIGGEVLQPSTYFYSKLVKGWTLEDDFTLLELVNESLRFF